MNIKKRFMTILMIVTVIISICACQPTPEAAAVEYKGGSLIDMISGNYEFEQEDVAALNGQTWNEEVYKTDDSSVTVDVQLLTQKTEGYPAVRVKDDTDSFLNSDYIKKMISYFFEGYQPYYRTMKPTKKECEMKILWYQQALSSGNVFEDEVEFANEQLEYYKDEYAAAPNDIPFDIKKDSRGEKYMRETDMNNNIVLIVYPNDGFKGIDISNHYLSYIRQTSLDRYDYEVGLSSLDNVPESVHMNATNALEIAVDSVNTIAPSNDMELVRTATINKASMYMTDINDFQNLEPECLVFYFMRSFNGVQPIYIIPSAEKFSLKEDDPMYSHRVLPEYIRVVVDDSQIVEWTWVNPCMITEMISENVPLMPFEQIKDIFRQQVKNYFAYLPPDITATIHIDKIVLSLMKIAEKDNIEGGLVIPVWDFIGTQEINFFGIKDGGDADYTFLTINAIDGTVIDRSLGY